MKNLTLLIILTIGLIACNGDGNDVVVNPTPTPDQVLNQLTNLASQNANEEPSAIENAANLSNDINALFDGEEPVEVEETDDIIAVINKADGS